MSRLTDEELLKLAQMARDRLAEGQKDTAVLNLSFIIGELIDRREENKPVSDEEAREIEQERRRRTKGLPVCEDCDNRGICTMNCGPAGGVDYWREKKNG